MITREDKVLETIVYTVSFFLTLAIGIYMIKTLDSVVGFRKHPTTDEQTWVTRRTKIKKKQLAAGAEGLRKNR
jgi:cobalamin biosynthesis protein CobD/CbiB